MPSPRTILRMVMQQCPSTVGFHCCWQRALLSAVEGFTARARSSEVTLKAAAYSAGRFFVESQKYYILVSH